ncbi:hypothetical protein BDZ91DRAFT_765451 [Kalaharituber pfeilii]|nr:hypothetical protein BDZ91DRAFT_765451 [Kalaharituber pfeilii]
MPLSPSGLQPPAALAQSCIWPSAPVHATLRRRACTGRGAALNVLGTSAHSLGRLAPFLPPRPHPPSPSPPPTRAHGASKPRYRPADSSLAHPGLAAPPAILYCARPASAASSLSLRAGSPAPTAMSPHSTGSASASDDDADYGAPSGATNAASSTACILPRAAPHTVTDYSTIDIPADIPSQSPSPSPSPPPFPPSRPKWTRPITTAVTTTWRFIKGPIPPIKTYITPMFPRHQSFPSRLLRRFFPTRRSIILLQLAFWFIWLLLFSLLTHFSRFRTSVGGVRLSATGGVRQLTCNTALWYRNNACGLNGEGCRPFSAPASLPFRCPSGCLKGSHVLNPRQVGNESLVFQSFVVGGPDPDFPTSEPAYEAPYRADSFICAAAVHAGVVSDALGGCGLLLRTGASDPQKGFIGSRRHGITSAGFDSSFPSSYVFARPPAGTAIDGCKDLRWHLLPISSLFTFIQALFSTNAAAMVGSIFVGTFLHVGFASDPPPAQANRNDPYELVSIVLGRFLPASFVMYMFYLHVLGPTWATNTTPTFPEGRNRWSGVGAGVKSPFRLPPQIAVERAILFLFGLWFAALNNVTFAEVIPLARLTPHDLQTQPGAKTALAIICIVLFLIAVSQIYYLRLEGRLPRYLLLYASFGGGLLGFVFGLQDMAVRIHHYILAMLLLPGTKIGNRLSMLWQGLLVGLFINGTARWGFASLLETKAILLGDAVYGQGGVPGGIGVTGGNSWYWNATAGERWRGNWEVGIEGGWIAENGQLLEGQVNGDHDEEWRWWQNVTITWRWPTEEENRLWDSKTGRPIEGEREWDGVSVLINDVERYVADIPEPPTSSSTNRTSTPGDDGQTGSFTWTRRGWEVSDAPGDIDGRPTVRWEKFRGVGDYTRAGVVGAWWPKRGEGVEGGWIPPAKGRTMFFLLLSWFPVFFMCGRYTMGAPYVPRFTRLVPVLVVEPTHPSTHPTLTPPT